LIAGAVVGAGAVVVGCWWIYPPAGMIVAGLLVLADVIHSATRQPGDREQ
jgi:hypothetical protein